MAKYPILYAPDATDFFNMGLGPLTTSLTATVSEERNGSFILEAEVLTDDAIYPLLERNAILKADAGHTLKDQRFKIKRIVPTDKGTAKIYAEHVSYLSQELSLKPEITIKSLNANAAIGRWKSSLNETNPFVVDSDITTTGSTKWRIDKVANPRQALGGVEGSLLDVYGGEYRFDNYHISLLKKRGTTANTVLAYGRNITSFEQELNITDTYTSVYAYAIYTDKNDNEQMVTIDGYVVDCENVSAFPNRVVKIVDFSNEFDHDEVPTKAKLKTLAEQYVTANDFGVPKVSMKVSFVDLSKTADYAEYQALEEVNLCDDVRVIFPKLGVDTVSKVTRTVWNVLSESYDEIEIGERRASLSTIINDQGKQIGKAEENANNALVSANGKNTTFYGLYGADGLGEPKANKVGDLWYKPNGDETEMYQWNGTIWEFVMSTATDPELIQALDDVGKEVEQAQSDSATALENANDAVNKANEASAKADQSQQTADQAKSDATNAAGKAQSALDSATTALEGVEGVKTDLTTEVTRLDGELSTKVELAEFNGLKGTVTSQGTQITQNTNDIKLKANQTEIDTIAGRVTSTESQLTVQAGKISALNTLTDGHTTQIGSLQTGYDGLSSTVALVQNRFTDGNNLITDGDFESGLNRGIELYQTLESYPKPSGNYAARLYVNGTAGSEYTQQWTLPTPVTLLANTEYTIEYDYSVAGTARGNASDYARDENGNWISGIMMEKSQHVLTGGQGVWKKYVNTFKLNQETVLSRLRFGFVLNGDGVGWKTIDNIKIYQGSSIATQFSNLTQEVDTIQATVVNNEANMQAQLIVLSDQITSTVGQLRDGNNLIDDGNFESGNGRGLSLIGQTDTYPKPSGNYMARLIKTGGTVAEDYYQIWTLPTPITLLANTEYTIEYDYSVAGTAKGNASDYLRTSTGSWVSGVMMDHESHSLVGGQGVWKKYTKTFSLSAETTISAMRFGFVLNGNGTGWKVIDNIKIYQGASTQSQITQLSDAINFRITNSDGSITQIDLANKVITLSGEQVNITGNTYIEAGVIKTAHIADAAITSAKIGSLSADKITAGTLNGGNVNIINLNADNIVSGKLDASLVNVANLNATNITSGTISAARIGAGTITADKIASNAITADKIAAGAITATKIASKAITADKLNVTELSALSSDLGTVTAAVIKNDYFELHAYGGVQPRIILNSINSPLVSKYGVKINPQDVSFYSESSTAVQGIKRASGGLIVYNSDKEDGTGILLSVASATTITVKRLETVITGSLNVTASKNAIHPTRDGVRATPAYELAESYLGDIGRNYTDESCMSIVPIEVLFSDTVNLDIPYEVFLQAYDDAHFWVSDFTSTYFVVKSDKPMMRFAWELKAKRRGFENERLVLNDSFDNNLIEETWGESA